MRRRWVGRCSRGGLGNPGCVDSGVRGGGRCDRAAAVGVKGSGTAAGFAGRAGGAAGRVGHADRIGRRSRVGQHAEGDGSATGEGGHQEQQAKHHRSPAPALMGVRLVVGWFARLRFGVVVGLGHEVARAVSGPRAPFGGGLQGRGGSASGQEWYRRSGPDSPGSHSGPGRHSRFRGGRSGAIRFGPHGGRRGGHRADRGLGRAHRGGAEGDGVFGVGVDGSRAAEFGGDQVGDHRNARGSADEQHGVQLGRIDLGRLQRPAQGGDGGADGRADHPFKLAAGQADLGLQVGQQHRDGGLGVRGQGFLGRDALVAQPDDRIGGAGIGRVEAGDGAVEGVVDVGEHGLVEVDAAEPLDAFRAAENVEAVLGGAQNGRIEGAPAEVVDRDQRAQVEAIVAGVVRGGGLGLGEQVDLAQSGQPGDLGEELELVGSPVRRVGQGDRIGSPALTLADGVDDIA